MLYPTNPACSTPKQSGPLQPGENTEQTNALPSKLDLCAHNIQTCVSITTTWGPRNGSPFLVHKEAQTPVIIWGEEVGCRAQLHHVLENFFPLSLQKRIHLLGHPQALQTRQPVRGEGLPSANTEQTHFGEEAQFSPAFSSNISVGATHPKQGRDDGFPPRCPLHPGEKKTTSGTMQDNHRYAALQECLQPQGKRTVKP